MLTYVNCCCSTIYYLNNKRLIHIYSLGYNPDIICIDSNKIYCDNNNNVKDSWISY